MGVPLDKASFLALFLETLFYGALPTTGIVELQVMMSNLIISNIYQAYSLLCTG
jgi:hypothetical protein